jgi:hypothetical protein
MKRLFPTIAFFVLACGDSNKPAQSPPNPTVDAETTSTVAADAGSTATTTAMDAGAATTQAPAPAGRSPDAKWTGLSTPESVLYDETSDRYLVSNINGSPTDADGNGFISELSPDGTVKNLKFIEGGKNKVKLDAPKGSAIANGTLYVADITVVRMFDPKTGAPKGEVKVPGATFLNDVTAASDGTIYVSDSGIKFGKNGVEPTGTAAILAIDKAGKLKTVAKGNDLGGPNGVLAVDKSVLVVTFGAAELYRVGDKGNKQDVTKLPKGSLDGLVQTGDGTLLVSSWDGQAIYKGKLGGTFEPVIQNIKAPADIGWDKKRSRVLVPRFEDNTVEAYEIK